MQIIPYINSDKQNITASIVTIGNFDGVHNGHTAIFKHLKQKSLALDIPSAIVTFEPHPLKILTPETAPLMITTFEQKSALIEKWGIDYLVTVPFSEAFSKMSAGDFVRKVLCSSLGMKHIIIGHDYAFGRGREGTFATLEQLGTEYGFSVEDLPAIGNGDIIFSSSLVRVAISDGDMNLAMQILGHYYEISGTVVHGRDIGHTLGFPTANIATSNEIIPPDGVYAVMVEIGGQLVKGACNIGCNPTFNNNCRSIEVFMLDYSDQIYDHSIKLRFVQKLRAEQKFADITELKSAIALDIAKTRIILDNASLNKAGLESCEE